MKIIPAGLETHLLESCTTLARICKITKSNGDIVFLTDYIEDLVYLSDTYKSSLVFEASAVRVSLGAGDTSFSLDILLGDEDITKTKIEAGDFDNAEVLISLVNYKNTGDGLVTLLRGKIGSIEYIDTTSVTFNVDGLLDINRMLNVENFSMNCRADFGDARCKVDIDALVNHGTIATVHASNQSITTDLVAVDNYFDNGIVYMTSGGNAGIALEVGKSIALGGQVTLRLPMPFPLTVGDTFDIYPGCDKTTTMCKVRWNNIVNFRGEPLIPDDFNILRRTVTTTTRVVEETPATTERVNYYRDPVTNAIVEDTD